MNNEARESIMDKVLIPKEVAELMRWGMTTTMNVFHRDDFPSYRVGRRLYVRESQLIKWVESQEK